ncbi:MAG: 30S ribosomal protein S6 [Deltaproteobacteria bacterium]|nr:30S ribosomal protein S6 [Deltaproteobacteria bacterium]MBW1871117.1 30S ribosomal protein S6 [Deltaproteobacteria bacterium]
MYLREYETIYILRSDLSDSEGTEVNQKLATVLDKQGAKILKQSSWGKKKLAYEIKKQPKGVFHIMQFLSQPGAVLEFERNLKILEPVLKFQTIRVATNVDVDKRLAEQEAANKAQAIIEAKREAEAAARAEAQAVHDAAMQAERDKAAALRAEEASQKSADETPIEEPESAPVEKEE